MANSPTSECSSSAFTPGTSNDFSSLPIMSLRTKILDKILENRVTLIIGETGCGKSSQVPQFLLDAKVEPILCTQPRRFAVVAVAKMVAKMRDCVVGGEVGFHIGHSKVMSNESKIVFKTAGVLLDEMREKGFNALNYKVIILDEVHERSVESDLILVCIKQFLLRSNDLRVVLMSATANISRYRDYFKDLGRGERVEVLAIPSSNQRAVFQRRVSYFEEVAELLDISSDIVDTCFSGPTPSTDIKPEMHKIICDLVVHIHETEPDIEKGILVFLPTYKDLEKQWNHLKPLSSSFKIHVLHRSIDTEQALLAMKIWKSHRKVILATNIAESSVTIPKVAYVIDSCRSLQVFWDITRKQDAAELVWVSKSQADQRKGRTGRTCDGQIYRLVTRSFFNKLEDYESPAILKLSLRQQVLLICCAEPRAINDPKVLMQKALDPPDSEVIEDALRMLVHIKAVKRSGRGRYEPTFYGRLLCSFSLSFDASVIVLKFGSIGILQEGILLGILMDLQPLPILHPFGQEQSFTEYAYRHFGGACDNKVQLGRKEITLMGNLSAYKFWQRVLKDKHRIEHLKQLLKIGDAQASTLLLDKAEEEWCEVHNLVQSSLHQISAIYEDILNSLHHFRPSFLSKCDGLPSYYDPYEFQHTCLLDSSLEGDGGTIDADDENQESRRETRKCFAVPFVTPSEFKTTYVAENLSTIIKEVRAQSVDDPVSDEQNNVGDSNYGDNGELCIYFMRGVCSRGNQCPFSHSLQAKKPVCKFFVSLQGCRNGGSCPFSHALDPSSSSTDSFQCLPEDDDATAPLLLEMFPTSSDGCILILDDTDLQFSSNLAGFFEPSKIMSTTSLSETAILEPSLKGVRIFWSLLHPFQTIIVNAKENPIPWNDVKCVLWFPALNSYSENLERQGLLIRSFFEYLAIRILADCLSDVVVILTMNNIKFSRLEVEKLARNSFFFLRESFPFDEASFGELSDVVTTKKPMVRSKAVSYVFELTPAVDIEDLETLRKSLEEIQ